MLTWVCLGIAGTALFCCGYLLGCNSMAVPWSRKERAQRKQEMARW